MGQVVKMGALLSLVVGLGAVALQHETLAAEEPPQGSQVEYPISVAVAPDGAALIVDLNLPGVWRQGAEGGAPELLVRGSDRLRQPLNRPRSIAVLEDGQILVGDSATREIYAISADGSGEPNPLTDGFLGIPMSLSVGPDGNLYVADLETRFVYRLPTGGGEPELFAKVSARGLHHAEDGTLWAVTPDLQPLVKISEGGEAEAVVDERVFQFPHNVVVDDEGAAYVTDGYAKAVWKIDGNGEPEKVVEGEPLMNPVGLAIRNGKLLIADPHAKQLFELDLTDKSLKPLL